MKVFDLYKTIEEKPNWASGTESMLHIIDKALLVLRDYDTAEYDDIMDQLYIAVNGYHFDKTRLDRCLSYMINDNGTPAPKWSVEDTNGVARNMGITFDHGFNEYDWNYVMNMMYSDYCDVLGESAASYAKMSNKFLNDKDAPEGKALRYSMCMRNKKDY